MAGASNGRSGDDKGSSPVEGEGRGLNASERRLDRCAFRQPDRESQDGPAAGIVGKRQFAAHES